jgi:hypothetical protein
MKKLISVPAWFLALALATVSVTFLLGCLLAISHFLAARSGRGWDFHPRCPSKKYFSSDSAHGKACAGRPETSAGKLKSTNSHHPGHKSNLRGTIAICRQPAAIKNTPTRRCEEREKQAAAARSSCALRMHAKLYALCEISLSTPLCRCCCCEAQKKDAHAGELLLAFRMRAF